MRRAFPLYAYLKGAVDVVQCALVGATHELWLPEMRSGSIVACLALGTYSGPLALGTYSGPLG